MRKALLLIVFFLLLIPLASAVSVKKNTTFECETKGNKIVCNMPLDSENIENIFEKVKTIDTSMKFFGTEYTSGEPATIWLQLLRNYQPINDATCYVTAYYPDKTVFLNRILMAYLSESDGLFYYDLTSPTQLGVYMLTASCYIPSNAWSDSFVDYSKLEAYENITISSGKAIISSFNQTSIINYTDETWESYELLMALGDEEAVDFDLGDLSTINYIQLCYYASREKTSVLANVSVGSFITKYNLTFPVKAQPTDWFCTIVPKTIFSNGVNRIGIGCYKGCTASDNTVIKVDLTSPNNNSYWWENSSQVWHNMSTEDYAIKVIYNRTIANTNGYVRSIPITLNESFFWDEFKSDYNLKNGSIDFKVLNSNNSEICTGLGNILSCAGATSPIKLYASLTRPAGNSPEIDEWLVSWLPPTIEEIRGSGEMHITEPINVTVDLTEVYKKITSVNETVKEGFGNTSSQISNLNQIIQNNFTYTNSLINFWGNTLNSSINWWGVYQNATIQDLNTTINWWGNFLNTTIYFLGNEIENKLDNIIIGNVSVIATVDYDEIAITVMQYLRALQKQELI